MTALRWSEPFLTVAPGDPEWEPAVDLINDGSEDIEVSGALMATALLVRPDGSPVKSSQKEWPMPAVLMKYALTPGESRPLRVALMLLPTEKAALTPGRYRLTDTRWGGLKAPDVDVEIG